MADGRLPRAPAPTSRWLNLASQIFGMLGMIGVIAAVARSAGPPEGGRYERTRQVQSKKPAGSKTHRHNPAGQPKPIPPASSIRGRLSKPASAGLDTFHDDYQFTRTPNRMTRGATIAWMLLPLVAFWFGRRA